MMVRLQPLPHEIGHADCQTDPLPKLVDKHETKISTDSLLTEECDCLGLLPMACSAALSKRQEVVMTLSKQPPFAPASFVYASRSETTDGCKKQRSCVGEPWASKSHFAKLKTARRTEGLKAAALVT